MSCVMANRVVLNCRKISKNVTCTVTGTTGGMTMIAADDDDDGVTKEVGGRREILSANLEEMMD
jgi:hypothetical protein